MSSFQTKTAEISHRRNYRLYGIWKIIIKVVEEAHNFFLPRSYNEFTKCFMGDAFSHVRIRSIYKQEQRKHVQIYTD